VQPNAEALIQALREERALAPDHRSTGASDADLDWAIVTIEDGRIDGLGSLSRAVVDRWSLTASLSDQVVAFARRTAL